ncbi:hypothetical protein PIB30_031344 [Stylosanthes scabra]|uniref:Uncharacterized protein n=1 Tax=Stylosanthes scabra TaxID=79078 RepID=A0ABU6UAP2_9FABA|nr:hypothetical protein [Stylosanthes scabra]
MNFDKKCSLLTVTKTSSMLYLERGQIVLIFLLVFKPWLDLWASQGWLDEGDVFGQRYIHNFERKGFKAISSCDSFYSCKDFPSLSQVLDSHDMPIHPLNSQQSLHVNDDGVTEVQGKTPMISLLFNPTSIFSSSTNASPIPLTHDASILSPDVSCFDSKSIPPQPFDRRKRVVKVNTINLSCVPLWDRNHDPFQFITCHKIMN